MFDPECERRRNGVRFRVYRKLEGKGQQLVETTNHDRVGSKQLGCWLRAVGEGNMVRLRVGLGRHGAELLPTSEERRAQETMLRLQEAERARLEAERADREARRADEAERELARLRALVGSSDKKA